MESRPGRGCARATVQRCFEGNRLAKDFQVQAYEQALPAKPGTARATAQASASSSEQGKRLTQEGGMAA
jgi:hypothetical protein